MLGYIILYTTFNTFFEGYYFITARSKEIIITKGGENIAPVPIEGVCPLYLLSDCILLTNIFITSLFTSLQRMLESMRFLSNVMVIGDNQPYLTMFVTIKCQVVNFVLVNIHTQCHVLYTFACDAIMI